MTARRFSFLQRTLTQEIDVYLVSVMPHCDMNEITGLDWQRIGEPVNEVRPVNVDAVSRWSILIGRLSIEFELYPLCDSDTNARLGHCQRHLSAAHWKIPLSEIEPQQLSIV
jgi:hypothetical protein